jgi:hypothetical protein
VNYAAIHSGKCAGVDFCLAPCRLWPVVIGVGGDVPRRFGGVAPQVNELRKLPQGWSPNHGSQCRCYYAGNKFVELSLRLLLASLNRNGRPPVLSAWFHLEETFTNTNAKDERTFIFAAVSVLCARAAWRKEAAPVQRCTCSKVSRGRQITPPNRRNSLAFLRLMNASVQETPAPEHE